MIATTQETKSVKPRIVKVWVEHRKDLQEDYQYDAGFIGVIAKCEIVIGSTVQIIRSGGLWGIESDAGREYLESVAVDELGELHDQLTALGIGGRAIEYAYRNIETIKK